MSDTGWTKDGDHYRKDGPGGKRALVVKYSSGWDASVRYPDGQEIRGPRYFSSAGSAKAWADREMNRGITNAIRRVW